MVKQWVGAGHERGGAARPASCLAIVEIRPHEVGRERFRGRGAELPLKSASGSHCKQHGSRRRGFRIVCGALAGLRTNPQDGLLCARHRSTNPTVLVVTKPQTTDRMLFTIRMSLFQGLPALPSTQAHPWQGLTISGR